MTRYAGAMLHYNVTGQAGGTWHYRVSAYNSAGSSSPSNVESTDVADPALAAPTLQDVNNPDGDGIYVVDWSEPAGATNYALEQSADPYFAGPQEIYRGPLSEFAVNNQPGGTWHYRVRALGDGSDRSPWSASKSTTVLTWIYLPALGESVP